MTKALRSEDVPLVYTALPVHKAARHFSLNGGHDIALLMIIFRTGVEMLID
jgi:hypothetical protein